ncbi:MAG: metallophosphatase [Marinilabilia sp.]
MHRPDRRHFIKILAAGSLAATFPFVLKADSQKQNTLTILHTNDVHSHLDPFPADHPSFPNMGGFARRSTLIGKLRKEQPHLLLLDAGDIFQGTPYFNFFGGEPEFKLMSKMQYDAATIGNHEFDNGLEHLAQQMQYADFPFICTNYRFGETILKDKTRSWKVIEKGPFRVGLIGLGINPSGLVSPANYKGMEWQDPSISGEETARFLKEEKKCNLVIALSHLGLDTTSQRSESDIKVASETSSIDVIIGGHSHTFLDQPEIVENKTGRKVIITQAGWGGVKLGQLTFTLQKRNLSFTAAQHDIA